MAIVVVPSCAALTQLINLSNRQLIKSSFKKGALALTSLNEVEIKVEVEKVPPR
jgi:hypothetical protein